jgi:hypothetical protein
MQLGARVVWRRQEVLEFLSGGAPPTLTAATYPTLQAAPAPGPIRAAAGSAASPSA